MKYSIKAASAEKISADCVVVTVWSKGTLSDEAKLIDSVGNRNISNITRSGDFTGKLGETQVIHRPTGARAKRVLLLGAGDRRKFTAKNAVKFLGSGLRAVNRLKASNVHFALAGIEVTDRDAGWFAGRLAQESECSSYRYDETKSKGSS